MTATPTADPGFDALLQFLKRSRGFDFTGYKRTSLERRFRRRMEVVGCPGFAEYLDHLEVHPDEYQELFDTLLINVTDFFRDPPVWEHLREEGLPLLLAQKPPDEPIRVWSAGCATGQEACTIAMVLSEALGERDFRRRVKIYATDVDEDALATARLATYPAAALDSVPAALQARYFEAAEQGLAFRGDLRRSLIFGRNNLVQDAPISRLDLLVCRNTLMYLTAETQAHVLRHFHFALRDAGLLMLGKSEMMISHRDLFAPLDPKRRLFRKLPRSPSVQTRLGAMGGTGPAGQEGDLARDAALDIGPHPQLIVSPAGALELANLPARALFGLGTESIGRPLGELGVSREPTDLLGPLAQAVSQRRRIPLGEFAHVSAKGDARRLDVSVVPLLGRDNAVLGAAIQFEDVSRYAHLEQDLETNRKDLEAAYEELQSTIDELETTNEELQSANEELQTTNEELQSTNEELETMNEELQSTNAELEAINDELRERTGQLDKVNGFLESILRSLGLAVVVLDEQQRVQIWNRGAEELWGLRSHEAVDQHFLGLDIGLRPERLAAALRAVTGGASEQEVTRLEAVNRRGRPVVCTTTVLPLVAGRGDKQEVRGAILMMEDSPAADGDGRG